MFRCCRCCVPLLALFAVPLAAEASDPPAGKYAALVRDKKEKAKQASAGDPSAAKYAVLVGINNYEHDNLRKLGYAEADVNALEQVLKASGYRVTLLTGAARDPSLRPTKENIEKHLKRVLGACKRKDTVLLAFAGHGLQFEGGSDAYFCPADARPFKDRADTLVSLGGVYRQLQQSFAGVKVLLVDACRDDPDTARGAGGSAARGITADNAPRPPRGVAALFSCSAGQQSYENDQLKHGVFFYHVLQGLRGEAARDGKVTLIGLTDYVMARVPESAKQSPNLKTDLSANPVLVTAARRTTAPAPVRSPVPAASRLQANTVWKGEIVIVTDGRMLPTTIYVQDRKNDQIKGEIHFRGDFGPGVLTFKGKIRGDNKVVWTTGKKSGNVTFPGQYEGSVNGRTLSGTWRVPSAKQSGRFTVKLTN